MTTTFELWDAETGNAVGSFSTRGEALSAVDALLESFGSEYADDLVLMRRVGEGAARVEARGAALLTLLGRQLGTPTPDPAPVNASD